MEEEYFEQKDIPGYDGWYQASTDGRIWSCKTGKFLKGTHTGGGLQISTMNHGDQYIHRLVALTWIDNDRPDAIVVDHINRNTRDNNVENLRWLTHSENNHNRAGKGYCWHKRVKRWYSQIRVNGKKIHLGSFDSEEDASKAFCDASRKYFPGIRNDLPY